MTDQEREAKIVFCGKQMEICMAAGDREKAQYWKGQMEAHIAQRSPEQVKRMEQSLQARISEPCYFCTKGDEDRPAILRRQAA